MSRCNVAVAMGLWFMGAVLSGCAHRNVVFNAKVPASVSRQESSTIGELGAAITEIPLYLDRNGDLYPGSFRPKDNVRLRGQVSLCRMLSVPASSAERVYEQDAASISSDLARRLHAYSMVAGEGGAACFEPKSTAAWVEPWRAVQDQLWEEKLAQINAGLDCTGGTCDQRQLLILIHGFNNGQKEAKVGYRAVMKRLWQLELIDPRTVLVPVYWDGLDGPWLNPPWDEAQYNAPLVGLSLRRLLNGLPAGLPVRILTHSSGGIVAASMIGDARAAFPDRNQFNCQAHKSPYCRYAKENAEDSRVCDDCAFGIPIPDDLRIGMLAAATPTFSFYVPSGRDRQSWQCSRRLPSGRGFGVRSPATTLIFGMNPKDGVVTKGNQKLEQVSALGATTMATGGEGFECFREVQDGLSKAAGREPPVEVHGFHFQDAPNRRTYGPLWMGESHSIVDYLQRDAFADFARLLLQPGSVTCMRDEQGLCRPSHSSVARE